MSDVGTRIGQRIKALREQAGLSQGDVARMACLSRVHLGSIERAVKSPTLASLDRIGAALNVDLAELVRDVAKPTKTRKVGPEEKFLLKVSSLVRGASEEDLSRIERLIRLYVEK